MKVGIVTRSEDRGLGIQGWEAYRHLKPAATLLVDMGELARGFPTHHDRYPDAAIVNFDGHRFDNVDTVQDFIRSVDVIYCSETPYDWRMCGWCADAGTALVVHTNPELHRLVADRDGQEPTVWWNPTGWHMDLLRDGGWTTSPVVEMPMPVDTTRAHPVRATPSRPTFLHVQGHMAMGDRNGTGVVARALRRVNKGQRWTIHSQAPDKIRLPDRLSAIVEVSGRVDDYWDLYDNADVLVMPRRYGGLSLPTQEAMAAGLAVVMPDCSPNRRWPIIPMLAEHPGKLNRRGIIAYSPNFVDLALVCDRLDDDPSLVDEAKRRSLLWAADNSWESLLPSWLAGFETAIGK